MVMGLKFGKFWLVVGGCGWLWLVLGGCGWLWVVVGGFGSFLVLVCTFPVDTFPSISGPIQLCESFEQSIFSTLLSAE